MSISNGYTAGNQGSNYAWQLAMLLKDEAHPPAVGPGAGTPSITPGTGTTLVGPITTSTSGTIPVGAMNGGVLNTGNANGTFNGAIIQPGIQIPFKGPLKAATSFNGTGTTLEISYEI